VIFYEFIEVINFGDDTVDLSGWSITDLTSTRHIFPNDSIIMPYQYLVVFGGGSPLLPDVYWQTASSGALGLNNGGDTITLYDDQSQVIHQFAYGSLAGNDQSLALFPEGEGDEYVLHSGISSSAGALFSPGTNVSGDIALIENDMDDRTVVPELPTFLYMLGGGLSFLLKRR